MEKSFVPKKTVTIQMTPEIYTKFNELLDHYGVAKTKLLEKLIREAHSELIMQEEGVSDA